VKENFLANISHELKTPINGIYGMVQLLESSELNVDQKENVEILKDSTKKMIFMVNNIIYMSDIKSRDWEINEDEINIERLINKITEDYSGYLKRKKIFFNFCMDETIPKILISDREKLNMVISQILNNAVKFTSKGNISINVLYDSDTRDNIYLTLVIKDTGAGISLKDRKKMFKPFGKLDKRYTKSYNGTGLGLVICKSICKKMGWRILCHSELGKGSTFSVKLKFKKAVVKELDKKDSLYKERVLIVDDDIVSRKLLGMICKNKGLKAHFAKNGKEAIMLYKKFKYRLILMDIQMPEISGLDALDKIKRLGSKTKFRTNFIAITAYALKGDKERFLSAGFNDYISKPIINEEMYSALDKYMKRT